MQIKPSFQNSISTNVIRWEIHRAGVHWLKIFSTTEEFDAWRTAPVTVPEASLPEATSAEKQKSDGHRTQETNNQGGN